MKENRCVKKEKGANSDCIIYRLVSKYRSELMGFAALWILFFHEWICIVPSELYALAGLERFIKRIGFCGVDMFFFLSGMGLFQAMEKKPALSRFYHRRCRRLLLPYLVMAFLYAHSNHWTKLELLKVVSGYRFFFSSIYTLLWFVPAIAVVYLVFPLFYARFMHCKNKYLFTALVLAAWLVASLCLEGHLREDLYGFTNRIPVIVLGILFGWIGKNGTVRYTKWNIPTILILLGLGLFLSYLTNYRGLRLLVPVSNCCVPNLLIAISLCVLLPLLFDAMSRFRITFRWLQFFGVFSFELYCVQEWLGARYLEFFQWHFSSLECNVLFFAVTVFFGYALYLLNRFVWTWIDEIFCQKGLTDEKISAR